MRTAIDSSVFWSIFRGEADAQSWVKMLAGARAESSLVICDVVLAEIAPLAPDFHTLESRLEKLGVEFDSIQPDSAYLAGEIFKKYRRQGGPRNHLIPDFLIGAHASYQADRLAAWDRGYLRRFFPTLRLLEP